MTKTLLELDGMRQNCLEKSNLLNDETPALDSLMLVVRLNEQRNLLIDYIIALEGYIKTKVTPDELRGLSM